MTSLSKREIGLLIFLLIALSLAGYYNFVLKPYFNDSDKITSEIMEANDSLNDLKMKTAATLMVDKKIVDIQDEIGKNLDKVLDSIDNPAIIVMLTKTLPPHAVNPNYSFSPSYKELNGTYLITVEATFQCTADGFKQVLTNLKNAKYLNRVITSSFTIQATNTTGNATGAAAGTGDARVSIEILTKSITPTNTEFNYT